MNNIKRRVLGITLALGLVAGIGAVPAHAEWKQNGSNVQFVTNGIAKVGWYYDLKNWYYFDNSGNMTRGWLNYNNIWYYFNYDGTRDSSKTSQTIPTEIQSAKTLLEGYSKQTLMYVGTQEINPTSGTTPTIIYQFRPQGQWAYGSSMYYYSPTTKTATQVTEGVQVNLGTSAIVNYTYSFGDCKKMADTAFKGETHNTYTIQSDGTVNKWGEYYFVALSSNTGAQIDAFYVSAYNGQIRR